MHAMVLAAGFGERMRPLSLLRAKPVLPVLNRPLLHWTLELLARHGVSDVVINLHHMPSSVRDAVGSGRQFGLRVRYTLESEILGTAGGPRAARWLLGKGPLLIVNGDMVFDFDLSDLVERHLATGAQATLALKPNPDPSRYPPVVSDRKGRVRRLPGYAGRIRGAASLFTGVHVIDPDILERLPSGPSDSIRDLYAGLLRLGEPVHGVRVRGPWHDLSSPALYLASQMRLLSSGFGGGGSPCIDPKARVEAGARVTRSVIGPGCVVKEGARVTGSVLWEDVSIGPGARVRDSILAEGVSVAEGDDLLGGIVMPNSFGAEELEALS